MKRQIIEIDESLCNGCGQCVPACAEGAIRIVGGKARLVAEKYCDGLGACLGACPTGALQVIERDADAFDEAAVRAHVSAAPPPHAGCPSARLQTFAAARGHAFPGEPAASALSHWPVKTRLMPPTAPFLDGADLLVAADCVPVAYPEFHVQLLAGRVVMTGCPKFDDCSLYLERFTELFLASDIRSVTVAVMQVPCCQGLPVIVEQALARAGKQVPLEKITVSLSGEILRREQLVA